MHWTWKHFHTWISCTLCDSEAMWQQQHSMNLCGLHQAAHHPSQPSKPCYCLPSASIRSWSHQLVTSCDDVLLARFTQVQAPCRDFKGFQQQGTSCPAEGKAFDVVLFKGPELWAGCSSWCSMTKPSCQVVPYSVGKTYLEVASPLGLNQLRRCSPMTRPPVNNEQGGPAITMPLADASHNVIVSRDCEVSATTMALRTLPVGPRSSIMTSISLTVKNPG